jgi:protease-4
MDDVYNGFVARVAEGRGMTPEQVDKIAGGRVWTGSQAKELGLVDELGGLDRALDYAALDLGVTNRHDLQVIMMPQPKGPLAKFLELIEGQVMIGNFLDTHRQTLVTLDKMLSRLETNSGISASAPGWAQSR